MATKIYPHVKIMQENGLAIDSDIITPNTRRSLTSFDRLSADFPNITDPTKKNIATKRLDESSDKITEMLTGDIEAAAAEKTKADEKATAKAAAEKTKADEKAAADKKAADEKAAAANAKKTPEEVAAEKKAADEKEKAEKAALAKKDNPYNLSDAALGAKKILDKIWSEKAKNNTMEITESELSTAGVNPWTYLDWTQGKIGPYNFKAKITSDTWTVTKDKKEEPAAA